MGAIVKRLMTTLLVKSSRLPSGSASLAKISIMLTYANGVPVGMIAVVAVLRVFFFVLFGFVALYLFWLFYLKRD